VGRIDHARKGLGRPHVCRHDLDAVADLDAIVVDHDVDVVAD
jgi:hypothetical protein